MKANCWEVKHCGREPGGANVEQLGTCPAATATIADGLNGGKNGGRMCWVIAGTFCGGEVQETFAEKERSCMKCDFYHRVRKEEGMTNFILACRHFRHILPDGNEYAFPRAFFA